MSRIGGIMEMASDEFPQVPEDIPASDLIEFIVRKLSEDSTISQEVVQKVREELSSVTDINEIGKKLAMMFMSQSDKDAFTGQQGDMSDMLPEGMKHLQTIGKIMEELGNEYAGMIEQGQLPPVADVIAFFDRRLTEEGVPQEVVDDLKEKMGKAKDY
jgi:hypothetical protein